MKGHTKEELLTPTREKFDTRMGPDHSGAPRHFAKPGEPYLHAHPHAVEIVSGQKPQTNVHADLGVAPKVKHAHQVASPVHSGMMARSRSDGTHFSGLSGQDLSRYDADGPDPLAGPPQGKRLGRVEVNPGCRSRSGDSLASENAGVAHARAKAKGHEEMHALGRAILNEALASGATRLPAATEENS